MSSSRTSHLIIIAGPNGAGKSTLAPHLMRDTFGLLEYVNADTIAAGLSAFSPESVAFEAGRIMLERLHDLAAKRMRFAFKTTLASRSYAPSRKRLMRIDIHNTQDLLFTHAKDIELIFRKAVREALLDHKRAGNPVAVWRDGKVVILQPDEIVIDEG